MDEGGAIAYVAVPFHQLNQARAINNEGQIVGYTADLVQTPEPTSTRITSFLLDNVAWLDFLSEIHRVTVIPKTSRMRFRSLT